MCNIVKCSYTLDRYPTSCSECPFYQESTYKYNGCVEREGLCTLGYMNGHDTKRYDSSMLFEKCNLLNDNRIAVVDPMPTCSHCNEPLSQLLVEVQQNVGHLRSTTDSTMQDMYCCPRCHRVYAF